MSKIKCVLSLLLLLLMVACSTTDEKLRAMIPDDAVGVVSIDVPSVLSKADMLSGENVVVPADLKKVIDEADPMVLGDILYYLPESGIDVNSKCYVFFSPGIFKAVALIPLVNEDDARTMVQKITSSKMTYVEGVDFATHLDYAYIVDDGVLMIGRYSTPVDAKVAGKAASDILGKTKPSLLANEDVSKNLADSCDVSAYINVKEFSTILKKNSRLSTIFGNVPAIEIITDSDIKAIAATVNFQLTKKDEQAVIDTRFIYQENGQYQQLYDNLINPKVDSASNVLNLIPGELDTYVAIKIDGSKLAQMPQMSKMFEILEATPLTTGLKHKEILSSIKGALVVGVGPSTVGDYNFVVAAQSTNPSLITSEIVEVANQRGQSPLQRRGEYFYDYGGQGIALGQTDDASYLRCVDFETTYSAGELAVLPFNLERSVVAVYRILKVGDKIEGYLNWGLHNKTQGTGFYFTDNEESNVVVSLLKYLCWKEPNSTVQENEDDFDYGF